jgi:hypothetical protein
MLLPLPILARIYPVIITQFAGALYFTISAPLKGGHWAGSPIHVETWRDQSHLDP